MQSRPGEAFHASDGLDQIQYGEYLQTAYKHFCHPCTLEYGREICIVGHGADISETRADIADAGDRSGYAGYEVEAESYIDRSEDYHNEQVAEYVAEGVVDLFLRADVAIYTNALNAVRTRCLGGFPVYAFRCQDCPVYLDSSRSGSGATADE